MTYNAEFDSELFSPKVSVVMNCLNGDRYLREAIESVFRQTYSNWEIVFWDNASTDSSAKIAMSYQKSGRLYYFRGGEIVPLGHARNLAIKKCRGQYIAFLDCDDIWLPQKLEKQIPLLDQDNLLGLVYSDTYFFNQNGLKKRFFSDKRPYRGYCFGNLLNNYLISLETVVIRRAALNSLHYWFDQRFNVIEEYDLFLRIGMKWKIDYIPEVLAKWRVHSASLTWREPDSFLDEMIVMLDKLKIDPLVLEKYHSTLLIAEKNICNRQAIRLWRNGNPKSARKLIYGFERRNLLSWLIFGCSFLPYKVIQRLHDMYSNSVKPS